jgi:hypothetical protein
MDFEPMVAAIKEFTNSLSALGSVRFPSLVASAVLVSLARRLAEFSEPSHDLFGISDDIYSVNLPSELSDAVSQFGDFTLQTLGFSFKLRDKLSAVTSLLSVSSIVYSKGDTGFLDLLLLPCSLDDENFRFRLFHQLTEYQRASNVNTPVPVNIDTLYCSWFSGTLETTFGFLPGLFMQPLSGYVSASLGFLSSPDHDTLAHLLKASSDAGILDSISIEFLAHFPYVPQHEAVYSLCYKSRLKNYEMAFKESGFHELTSEFSTPPSLSIVSQRHKRGYEIGGWKFPDAPALYDFFPCSTFFCRTSDEGFTFYEPEVDPGLLDSVHTETKRVLAW